MSKNRIKIVIDSLIIIINMIYYQSINYIIHCIIVYYHYFTLINELYYLLAMIKLSDLNI